MVKFKAVIRRSVGFPSRKRQSPAAGIRVLIFRSPPSNGVAHFQVDGVEDRYLISYCWMRLRPLAHPSQCVLCVLLSLYVVLSELLLDLIPSLRVGLTGAYSAD